MSQELSGLEFDRIGHYEIRHKIAEGGFGVVYKAHDTRLNRTVAIKVLHSYHAADATRTARFLREARSAAKLQHPNIVQVYDILETEGCMALVMEFVEGKTLDAYLKENPEVPLADRLELAAQIAETLHVAHKNGIIHRDVKPPNVLIDEPGRIKLTDFSLARLLDGSLTQLTGENNVMGTPAYMSPEQCEGKNAVPQSDLYSLGIIVYEMATGSLPFEAENYLALLRHHMDTPPTPVRLVKPSLPLALESLIMQCLSKDPEKRPADGEELARRLREIARELALTRTPGGGLRVASSQSLLKPSAEEEQAEAAEKAQAEAREAEAAAEPDSTPPGPTGEEQPSAAKTPAPIPAKPDKIQWAQLPWPVRIAAVGGLIALAAFVVPRLWSGVSSEDSPVANPVTALLKPSPLREYVKTQDSAYAYEVAGRILGDGYRAQVLDLTSQTWHGETVNPGRWRHWLTVIVPTTVKSETALLVLSEGRRNLAEQPERVPELLSEIAIKKDSVVVLMEGFPRDRMSLVSAMGDFDETDPITRDQLSVASFEQFLDTGDGTWPIVCPLVKSVVRAMDAVQDYLGPATTSGSLDTPVTSFVLTGAANGWGVWLTGAVDDRVAAIAPIGFDFLNIDDQVAQQVGLMSPDGFPVKLSSFMEAFRDSSVMPALDSEEGENLLDIIDPYEYRDQLTMPKMILLPATTDPIGTVDAARHFLGDLKGETHIYYAPNMADGDSDPLLVPLEDNLPADRASVMMSEPERDTAYAGGEDDDSQIPVQTAKGVQSTLRAFYHRVLADKPMPQFTWSFEERADEDAEYWTCTVTPDLEAEEPAEVRFWFTGSDTRDFRMSTLRPEKWYCSPVEISATGQYASQFKKIDKRYVACFMELVYPSKMGVTFSVTTPVQVLRPKRRQMEDKYTLLLRRQPARGS